MTYKELLKRLQQLSPEKLEDTVTVYDPYTDEYTAVVDTRMCDDGVLDDGHEVLVMKG